MLKLGVAVNPRVAVARRLAVDTRAGLVHRQVQRHHRVAARRVRQRILGRAVIGSIGVAVNPRVAVARRLVVNTRAGVLYPIIIRYVKTVRQIAQIR